MLRSLFAVFSHMHDRWRTVRAIAHLDPHLREDMGIETSRNPWDASFNGGPNDWTRTRGK